jgi:hypothetical protein
MMGQTKRSIEPQSTAAEGQLRQRLADALERLEVALEQVRLLREELAELKDKRSGFGEVGD